MRIMCRQLATFIQHHCLLFIITPKKGIHNKSCAFNDFPSLKVNPCSILMLPTKYIYTYTDTCWQKRAFAFDGRQFFSFILRLRQKNISLIWPRRQLYASGRRFHQHSCSGLSHRCSNFFLAIYKTNFLCLLSQYSCYIASWVDIERCLLVDGKVI